MPSLDITVPGRPQGYQRTGTRIVKPRKGAAFVSHYEQAETRAWRADAVARMVDELGAPVVRFEVEPVRVTVTAVGARPLTLPKRAGRARLWRTSKPDVDNICKAVLDALVQGGVLRDDVLVAELIARSLVAADGEAPHVRIEVSVLEPLPVVPWPKRKRAARGPSSEALL